MKEYLKPTCVEIELRQEETVASSNCNTTWVGSTNLGVGTGGVETCYKTQGS